jgi:hypothetical protein
MLYALPLSSGGFLPNGVAFGPVFDVRDGNLNHRRDEHPRVDSLCVEMRRFDRSNSRNNRP